MSLTAKWDEAPPSPHLARIVIMVKQEGKSKLKKDTRIELSEQFQPLLRKFESMRQRYKVGRVDKNYSDGLDALCEQLSEFETNFGDSIKREDEIYLYTLRIRALIAEGFYWLGHSNRYES